MCEKQVSKFAISPEDFLVCREWLCFLWAFTFSLVVKLFCFCIEHFLQLCELTINYDTRWIILVMKIAIYGCLYYS